MDLHPQYRMKPQLDQSPNPHQTALVLTTVSLRGGDQFYLHRSEDFSYLYKKDNDIIKPQIELIIDFKYLAT